MTQCILTSAAPAPAVLLCACAMSTWNLTLRDRIELPPLRRYSARNDVGDVTLCTRSGLCGNNKRKLVHGLETSGTPREGGTSKEGGTYTEKAGIYTEEGGIYTEEGGTYAEEGGTYAEEGGIYTEEGGTYAEKGVHEVGFDLTEWLVFDDHKMMLLFLSSHESTEPRLLAQPAQSQ